MKEGRVSSDIPEGFQRKGSRVSNIPYSSPPIGLECGNWKLPDAETGGRKGSNAGGRAGGGDTRPSPATRLSAGTRGADARSLPPALPSLPSTPSQQGMRDAHLATPSRSHQGRPRKRLSPVLADADLRDDSDALVARAAPGVTLLQTTQYRKAVQRNPTLQQDADRLLATYGVGDLAALMSMLKASLAGHRAMGGVRYDFPADLEVRLLAMAREAVRARDGHGSKSKQSKAIGAEALRLIKSGVPSSPASQGAHSRARRIWESTIKKVRGQS